MFARLAPYAEPILTACFLFPFAAALFTLPFTVINYRKYGGIAVMRVIVVYSFILYSMCAFLLTVLPLYPREVVAAMPDHAIGWIPFRDLAGALETTGVLTDPLSGEAWLKLLKSPQVFQLIANIIMQVPLGVYLRYYFRRNWKQTLLIGLLVSLFYELTQLSGLFFYYPKPYRFTEMDDLICNTLGAMIGFWIAPILCKILPTREEIDRISYKKGENLTLIRRLMAAILDTVICMAVILPLMVLVYRHVSFGASFLLLIAGFFTYYVVLPYALRGSTFGHRLLRLRIVHIRTGERVRFSQLLIRHLFLHIIEPLIVCADVVSVALIVVSLAGGAEDPLVMIFYIILPSLILLGSIALFMGSLMRHHTLPHGLLSHTEIKVVSEKQPK